MPKSPIYAGLPASERLSPGGRFSHGMLWGGAAGAVIGTGISLSIGLFYISNTSMTGLVILVSTLLGGLFGRVMGHLLSDVDVSFLDRAAGGAHHRIAGNIIKKTDLTDYRTLKAHQLKKNIPDSDAVEIIHSVRASAGSGIPANPGAPEKYGFTPDVPYSFSASASRRG